MELVLLDTQIVIWGVLRQAGEAQREFQRRARWLLHELENADTQIVLPTIVLSELMVPMSPEQRASFLETAREQFAVVPFDDRAADIAAGLWQKHRKLRKQDRTSRQVMKADVLILASAYAAGARVTYSHDRKCRRLAELLPDMVARDLPRQPPVFDFMIDGSEPSA